MLQAWGAETDREWDEETEGDAETDREWDAKPEWVAEMAEWDLEMEEWDEGDASQHDMGVWDADQADGPRPRLPLSVIVAS